MNQILLVFVLLLSAAAAESIRETETMDPAGIFNYESSGSLPDDEDFDDYNYHNSDEEDDDLFDDHSGSGDSDVDDEEEEEEEEEEYGDVETATLDNRIPEDDVNKRLIDTDIYRNNDNEIIPHVASKDLDTDPSNEISLPSVAHDGFFQRTEGIVAIVAGILVGLVFAVFIIVFVVVRKWNNKKNPCDSVKKPIYTKAPTVDV